MDNIDDIFMADYKESLGLGTRFQFAEDMPVVEPDPMDVSMEGVTVPERSVGEYGAGLGETWLNMLRGMGAATAGAGGDIEAILTGIKDAIMAEGDQSAWEAFQQGMGKETVLPSTEDVTQVFPEVPSMSAMTPEEMQMAQGMGEFGGIPGAVAGTVKAGKKLIPAAGAMAAPAASAADEQDFAQYIADKMEGWHGGIPKETADAREKGQAKKSLDVGYGHKIKKSEEASGLIHGIPFKDEQGNYIELSQEDALKILNADLEAEAELALNSGWAEKLDAIGSSWSDLDQPYRQVLASLAFNIGGAKAGETYTKVLKAAADNNVAQFAKEIRRQDAGKFTAGMDNRAAKELYAAGLISSLSEVKNALPLANAKSGIPQKKLLEIK